MYEINLLEGIEIISSIPNITNYFLTLLIITASFLLIWNVSRITPEVSYKNLQLPTRILYVTIIVSATVLLVVLWGLGKSIAASLVAILTLISSIIARKTLVNTISGIQIAYLEPFTKNDWIKIGEREGVVKKLTLNRTIIQSPDGEDIIIPNKFIKKNIVVNKSNGGNLRQSIEISVPLSHETQHIKDIIKRRLGKIDGILQIPNPKIHITDISESEITISIRYWIEKPHRRQIMRTKDNVINNIREILRKEDIIFDDPNE